MYNSPVKILIAACLLTLFMLPNISYAHDEVDLITGCLTDADGLDVDQYQPDTLMFSGKSVLWDTSHGIYLTYSPSGNHSSLVVTLRDNGYWIYEYSAGILHLDLENYDIIVISVGSAWDSVYSTAEVLALQRYVTNGGGLLLLGDNTNCPNDNVNPVSQAFGTTVGVTHVYPNDTHVTEFSNHVIFSGISDLFMRSAGEITGTLYASEQAWADIGDAVVTIFEFESGRVVTLGDIAMLANSYIGVYDNRDFAVNIFDWLSGS